MWWFLVFDHAGIQIKNAHGHTLISIETAQSIQIVDQVFFGISV